ncbi:MAG: hypothetical protein L6R28_16195 [Planctomycetes bacterium]|nr:hypothetical protein [Planctomycetota bacterium]
MSETMPPAVPPPQGEGSPGVSGCIGMAIMAALLCGLWFAFCFLFYAWLGPSAGAAAFFVPPIGLMLWAMFSKHEPKGDGKGNAKGGRNAHEQ